MPEGAGHQAVPATGAGSAGADQACGTENPQVFGHGGLGQRELVNEVTARARVARGQQAENADAGGMPEGLGERREPGVGRRIVRAQSRDGGSVWWTAGGRD